VNDYTPISCDSHSSFELFVMNGKPIQVSWRDPDGQLHLETVLPKDVLTRNSEEFLLVECRSGQLRELRLDRILTAQPMDSP
jgi:transcriptional antiterminator Rof (Rho-off)